MPPTENTSPEFDTPDFDTLRRLVDDRWTCRQFLPEPVSADTITTLLDLAQRTPSWCNTQPWQVEVTTGAATDRFRKQLLSHLPTATPGYDLDPPARYTGIHRERRRACGYALYDSVGIAKEDRAATLQQSLRNFELFDAPHVAIISSPAELGAYGAVDCGLWLENFLLGAQALGLGAAPQAALASYSEFVRSFFGIPEERLVLFGVSFGYPDREHPVNGFRTERAGLEEAVNWHTS